MQFIYVERGCADWNGNSPSRYRLAEPRNLPELASAKQIIWKIKATVSINANNNVPLPIHTNNDPILDSILSLQDSLNPNAGSSVQLAGTGWSFILENPQQWNYQSKVKYVYPVLHMFQKFWVVVSASSPIIIRYVLCIHCPCQSYCANDNLKYNK